MLHVCVPVGMGGFGEWRGGIEEQDMAAPYDIQNPTTLSVNLPDRSLTRPRLFRPS